MFWWHFGSCNNPTMQRFCSAQEAFVQSCVKLCRLTAVFFPLLYKRVYVFHVLCTASISEGRFLRWAGGPSQQGKAAHMPGCIVTGLARNQTCPSWLTPRCGSLQVQIRCLLQDGKTRQNWDCEELMKYLSMSIDTESLLCGKYLKKTNLEFEETTNQQKN